MQRIGRLRSSGQARLVQNWGDRSAEGEPLKRCMHSQLPLGTEALSYLDHGSHVGRHLRSADWSCSDLGDLAHWPSALHDTLRITFNSDFPHIVYWGRSFHTFWNDAASAFFVTQHPGRLGYPLAQVQVDVMRTLRPLLQQVMDSGRSVIRRDLQLFYKRNDYLEEFYEIFSYSPLMNGKGEVMGVIAPILDTTSRVIGERRMALLADLATGTRGTRTLSQYCAALQSCLQRHPLDLPLWALYVEEGAGKQRASTLSVCHPSDSRWPSSLPAAEEGAPNALSQALQRHALSVLPVNDVLPDTSCTVWDRGPDQLVVLPVADPATGRRSAHLLCALNPYKRLDGDYQTFLTLVVAQVSQGLADTLAVEREADRALAEVARLTRLTTMGELATSIAHEVNQPLAAMVIDATAAQQWLTATPPDFTEVASAARRIIRNGEHAGKILSRTRRFLQRAPIQRQALDLRQLAWEGLSMVKGEAVRHRIRLRARFAASLSPVEADRTQVLQVVINLLLNAVEAMTDEPLKLSTGRREVTLDLRESQSPPGVRVSVRDSGRGLEPSDAARVFDPFFTTKPDGLGFGLSISRSIVEAHGGLIWAEPGEPPGTTFAFVLPVASSDP